MRVTEERSPIDGGTQARVRVPALCLTQPPLRRTSPGEEKRGLEGKNAIFELAAVTDMTDHATSTS